MNGFSQHDVFLSHNAKDKAVVRPRRSDLDFSFQHSSFCLSSAASETTQPKPDYGAGRAFSNR